MTDWRTYLDDRVRLYPGDCREIMPGFEANSFDSCVCDPPYALVSIGKRFGKPGSAEAKSNGATGVYRRAAAGFMGKLWDHGEVAFDPEFWVDVLRASKPGGHLLAFGGTRTYHRLTCAIEDAGFEIRDAIMWHYGSGFPKSHDVSKGIDKAAGVEREAIGIKTFADGTRQRSTARAGIYSEQKGQAVVTAPATDAARQWQGWGTALKPATEIIVLARKPLSECTVAANVLKWGCGAIHIDGCRGATDWDNDPTRRGWQGRDTHDESSGVLGWTGGKKLAGPNDLGRWPANVVHDGSEEVLAAFPDAVASRPHVRGGSNPNPMDWGNGRADGSIVKGHTDDGGSAARFFYTAKADANDRIGSKHPTVKPIDLMRWLCRLVTPPGGTVLDPFAGTGTTAEAAYYEGFSTVLIEREEEYQADIERRMKLVLAGPDERKRESVKAKNQPIDAGPLFT